MKTVSETVELLARPAARTFLDAKAVGGVLQLLAFAARQQAIELRGRMRQLHEQEAAEQWDRIEGILNETVVALGPGVRIGDILDQAAQRLRNLPPFTGQRPRSGA